MIFLAHTIDQCQKGSRERETVQYFLLNASHGVFWFSRQKQLKSSRLIQIGFQKHKVLKHLHQTRGLHSYLILRKAFEKK